ncbi:hypothetical protein RUM44_002715 [Polyplax serrata]|uniref:Tyrosine decarboxylase n=1 Tax=Polyplax serrata TaxID=468196 RepID=A0ABR1AFJ0_POLSC
MDSAAFRTHGKEMVEFVCQYMDNIKNKKVISSVEPGYLAPLLPKEAPLKGEDWKAIITDVEEKILPGITHWQHPRFHAYFPSGNSFPSILADMLSDVIGCIGFSWKKMQKLLTNIVVSGVIQPSASDCILVCMLAARAQSISHLKKIAGTPDEEDSTFLPQLVAYCSREAHSCVEKAAMISLVKLRVIEADEKCSLRGEQLKKAIDEDVAKGLHPFFISTTLGTTASCGFDNLTEIGPIAKALPACWLHADGAYAGNGFICPELRYLMKGINFVDSFNTNCNKWLLVCFDCSCLWVRDRFKLTHAMVVDPLYLQHDNSRLTIDYRHWGIPLSRRFRSLKLWFTLRSYGIEGIQAYIRNHCTLAKEFEKLVRNDDRFEVCNEVIVGLVCFRLIGSNTLNQELLASINSSRELHMIPSMVKGKYVIRFCVINQHATMADIEEAWHIIRTHATKLQASMQPKYISNKDLRNRRLTRRFSFTRSVSREIYERRNSRNSLHDGATPIAVLEDEDINDEDMEDVFEQAVATS